MILHNFKNNYRVIVMGASAGGMDVFSQIFSSLRENFQIPVLVVQHVHRSQSDFYIQRLNRVSPLTIKEAEDKETICPGFVYFSPPDYHLLIDDGATLSLSVDERVQYSRPSIDVLFNSAVEVFNHQTVGVLFTGANQDGAEGMCAIQKNNGLTIIQDPETARHPVMPQSALNLCDMDFIFTVDEIIDLLNEIPFDSHFK